MNWEAISAIAELLAAGGIIASVLYVAAQIRQNTKQSRSAAQQAFIQELGNALRTQAQNREWADLLLRGLNDLESLDPTARLQFTTHIGQVLRLYESAYLHYLDGALDRRFWHGLETTMTDILGYSGVRATFELRRHHFTEEFGKLVDGCSTTARPRMFAEPWEEPPLEGPTTAR